MYATEWLIKTDIETTINQTINKYLPLNPRRTEYKLLVKVHITVLVNSWKSKGKHKCTYFFFTISIFG